MRLLPIDLIVLAAIILFRERAEVWPSMRQLYWPYTTDSLVNDYIRQHNVDPLYCTPLTSMNQLYQSVLRLRKRGLLTQAMFAPTQRGKEIYIHFFTPQGEIRELPYSFDIDEDGEPCDFVYSPKLRSGHEVDL
jgi:hypothetical protein